MKGGSRRTLCECGKCFGSDLNSWAQKNLSWQTPAWYGFCNKKSKEFIRRVYCKIPSTWLLLKKTIIAAFLPVTMSTQKKTICVSPIIFFGKISIYSELCDIVLSSLWFSTSDFDKHVFFLHLLSLVFDSTYKAAGFWLSLSDPYPSTFPTWEFLTVARLP